MEVSVRTTHRHLVTRFQGKDVRRSDTRINIHKATAVGLERRSSDTYCQHEHITLGRIVGHRVSTYGRLRVDTLQREEAKLLPCRQILVADKAFIDILVIIHRECRNLDLCIRTRQEVHMGTGRKLHFEFLDKGSHVFVGDNGTFVLFYSHH